MKTVQLRKSLKSEVLHEIGLRIFYSFEQVREPRTRKLRRKRYLDDKDLLSI